MIDMSKAESLIAYNMYAGFMFLTTFLDLVMYAEVWYKIKTTQKRLKNSSTTQGGGGKDQGRYDKTAKILTLFVASYVVQWWPFMVYAIWAYVALPPMIMYFLTVLFCNMGGVCNFFAYTFVRRSYTTK